ncbi:MAG: nuclear transport factor 2 family protein [Sediminicola sp.]
MQQNKEILIKANNAIKNGDHEGFLAFCTDDTEWKFIGDLTLKGKDAVRQWMAENYIEPPKFDVKYLIAENDFVTAVGEVSMTDKDGKATHYSYSDVWRFRNGKMAELSAFVIENK